MHHLLSKALFRTRQNNHREIFMLTSSKGNFFWGEERPYYRISNLSSKVPVIILLCSHLLRFGDLREPEIKTWGSSKYELLWDRRHQSDLLSSRKQWPDWEAFSEHFTIIELKYSIVIAASSNVRTAPPPSDISQSSIVGFAEKVLRSPASPSLRKTG